MLLIESRQAENWSQDLRVSKHSARPRQRRRNICESPFLSLPLRLYEFVNGIVSYEIHVPTERQSFPFHVGVYVCSVYIFASYNRRSSRIMFRSYRTNGTYLYYNCLSGNRSLRSSNPLERYSRSGRVLLFVVFVVIGTVFGKHFLIVFNLG